MSQMGKCMASLELKIKQLDAENKRQQKVIGAHSIQAHHQAEDNRNYKIALKLAYEAMNYLGDILNAHDMAQPEDEAVTKEAFEVVSKIVGLTKP